MSLPLVSETLKAPLGRLPNIEAQGCHVDTGVSTLSAYVKPTSIYGNLPNGALSGSNTIHGSWFSCIDTYVVTPVSMLHSCSSMFGNLPSGAISGSNTIHGSWFT